jgi:peptidoglycan/LPS O-acetylase OafA/YrhL
MPRSDRSDALDGLRALAALSVVAFHVWLYREDRPRGGRHALLDHVLFELHLGLICFFVLSGFLLYRAFARAALSGGGRRRVDVRTYATRRIARIVPAYYASIVLCLVLYAAAGYREMLPPADQLPLFAAFAQNYSWDAIMGINPVTWTLCVEAAFYVALPLIGLAAATFARRPSSQALLLASLVALTLAWNALAQAQEWSDIAEKSLPAYAGHFAAGMLAALWVEARRAPLGPRATAALAAAGLALVAASGWWYETPAIAPDVRAVVLKLPAALGFALIVAAAAAGRGAAVAWLRARPLAWAGVVSYGVYLWHLPLILLGNHLGLLPQPLPARLAIVTAAALVAGWASWTLV